MVIAEFGDLAVVHKPPHFHCSGDGGFACLNTWVPRDGRAGTARSVEVRDTLRDALRTEEDAFGEASDFNTLHRRAKGGRWVRAAVALVSSRGSQAAISPRVRRGDLHFSE